MRAHYGINAMKGRTQVRQYTYWSRSRQSWLVDKSWIEIENLDCATIRDKYRPGEALSVRFPGAAFEGKSVIRGFRFRCTGAVPADKEV